MKANEKVGLHELRQRETEKNWRDFCFPKGILRKFFEKHPKAPGMGKRKLTIRRLGNTNGIGTSRFNNESN